MKVSAVIPAYNRAQHIQRALDSVLAQTPAVHEIILVDDGSTDGTADVVEARYGPAVRVIRQSNTGVSGARRRGIEEATGDWIAFLDSDDEWTPGRNAEMLAAASSVPADVAWLFGDLSVIEDNGAAGTLFGTMGLPLPPGVTVFEDALKVQIPFQFCMLQASFIRRDALQQCGCFQVPYRHSEDVLAGIQVACRYRFAAIPTVVTKLFRTSDLTAESLALQTVPDYYLARMAAFSLIIEGGHKGDWGRHYADAVRGLCKLQARRGQYVGLTAAQQFRYEISLKSVVFMAAALLGRPGFGLWRMAAAANRAVRG
jgi:glycosyltransferase involved in cell wall biosynthesis